MNISAHHTPVALMAGACLLGLVAVLKNVVHVPADVLSRDVTLYIILYCALAVSPGLPAVANRSRLDRPIAWGALFVLITVAIISLYALQRWPVG
jgi:hypothetical protein